MRARTFLFAFFMTAPILAGGSVPDLASLGAQTVDRDFMFLAVFAAVGVVALFFTLDVLIVMNLRQDPDQLGTPSGSDRLNRTLAILVPLLLVVALVLLGVQGYVDSSVAPTDALAVEANGGPDGWSFRYSDAVETDALHVPAERPVRLTLSAQEGPMTLAIPAFRLRRNAKPEASTNAWFEASQPGEYALLSSTSSLSGSVGMNSTVTVLPPLEFDSWLESKSDVLLTLPPAEAGRVLVERKGCPVCHTVDGSRLTGPSFLGLIGRSSELTDGSTAVADEAYIRQSILDPASQVVAGFEPIMPSFEGQLRDEEIDAIIAYFTSLSETGEAP